MNPRRPSPRARGTEPPRGALPVLGVLAAALLLRAVGLGHGLPDFLDEAIPLRLALAMKDPLSGAIDWNPHAFNYPSLSIYLQFVAQLDVFEVGRLAGAWSSWADYVLTFWHDPTAMVVAARVVGALCDVAAAWAVLRAGERLRPGAGVLAGALVAVMPAVLRTSRAVYCDSLMLAATAWALERALAWYQGGRGRDLALAAVLVGLAAGSKYPAAVLLAPLALLVVARERPGRAARDLALVVGLATAAFLATTPYALLDRAAFVRDFAFEGAHARTGHFGSLEHVSFGYQLANLAQNLGWVGLAALAVAAVQLVRERAGRVARERAGLVARERAGLPERAALWLALVGFGLPISLARIDAERYVLPVAMCAALLAAPAALAAAAWASERAGARGRGPALLAGVALLAQPAWLGAQAALAGDTTTQIEARRWLAAAMGPSQLLVQEYYGAPLTSRLERAGKRATTTFLAAGPRAREAFERAPAWHVFEVPLITSGRVVARFRDARGRAVELEPFAHASDINPIFYQPRLYADADYLLTSSAVRGRFEADPSHSAPELAFYAALDRDAERAATFAPHGRVTGPTIVVYRLGDRWRASAAARPPDPLAWTAVFPPAFRESAQALVGGAPDPTGATAPPTPDTGWVRALRSVFLEHLRKPYYELASEYAGLERNAAGAMCAEVVTAVSPADSAAAILASVCERRGGQPARARAVLEAAFAAGLAQRGNAQLEHARVLIALGQVAEARAELDAVLAAAPAGDPLADMAQRLRARLGGAASGSAPVTGSSDTAPPRRPSRR